jgi:N-acetylglucosaminyl-diphospho-decaprenol L-rhamnosyltransferase
MTDHSSLVDPAKVAVIVTHYKSVPALRASIESILAVADPASTEVVVVDSEEQDGTEALVRELASHATFIGFPDDVGYAVSVNAGVAITHAPYILVLNADVRISPGLIETLIGAFEDDSSLGVVSPVLRYDDGTLQDSAFRFYRPSTILHRRTATGRTAWGKAALRRFSEVSREVEQAIEREDSRPVRTDWAIGAALMVRRSAVDHVGTPDSRYWMYFEDVDWCLRMWQAGWEVAVVPSAVAHHTYARASRTKGPMALFKNEMARVHLHSAVKFFQAHGLRPTRDARSRRPATHRTGSRAIGTDVVGGVAASGKTLTRR